MEENSKEVTATVDTKDAITDRYEVETNIVSEPTKEEPAKKVETKPESDSESEPSEEPQESKPINPRTAARKAEKERLIRENAALAERVKLLEAKEQPKQPEGKKVRDLTKEPDIQDYGDDVIEYVNDLAEWKANQTYESRTQQANQQKQIEAYNQSVEAVAAAKPDFAEKVGALVESNLVTPEIESAVLSSNLKAELTYHLAQYGGDLMALRGLPKELLPNAIKEIESFIKKGGNQQEKPRVTQASPPITPPSSTGRTNRSLSSYSQEEIENMPLAEYNRIFVKK